MKKLIYSFLLMFLSVIFITGCAKANAGKDRTAMSGSTVVLDGSKSSSSTNKELLYKWEQVGGKNVELSDKDTSKASFIAPNALSRTLLTFRLTVVEVGEKYSNVDYVKITILPNETPDTVKPLITLLGEAAVTLTAGESYTDAGATAQDDRDGNITDKIIITGSVDTATAGTYTLSYNVSDTAGNAADTVTRTVVVQTVATPPTITIQKGTYKPNDIVTVTIDGTLSGDRDWAGVYRAEDNNDWNNVIAWNWVNNGENTLNEDTKEMPAGNYEVRLFFHNATDIEKAKSSFTVSVAEKEYGKAGSHSTDYQPKNITSQTTVYYPTDLAAGDKVPVVFFTPGWHANAEDYKHTDYSSLLNFIASQGYYVIYIRQGWLNNSTFTTYQDSLDLYAEHIDTSRIGVIGHSLGGGNTFKILNYFSKEKDYGKNGRFIMVLEGWYAWQMNEEDLKNLPSNTNIVMQQYGEKGNNAANNTDPRIVLTEYYMLDSIPKNQKDYQVYAGADHHYPYGSRDYDEMQIILKPLDALMTYTFGEGLEAARVVALEQGSDDPYKHANGIQEVKPIVEYGSKCDGSDTQTNIDYCDMAQWYYSKQLILHQKGHWRPSMANNFASRAAYINTLPFSGFTMVGNSYTNRIMEPNTPLLSYEYIWNEVKDVKDLYPTKSNFLVVDMHFPADFWNDAVWDNVTANFKTLAKVAKDLGFRGIIYDDEAYDLESHKMINYKHGNEWYDNKAYKNPNYTFSEHSTKITARFKKIMEAMISEYSAIDVLYYHSPVEGHIKANTGIDGHPVVVNVGLEREHEWIGAMFVGLKQGLSREATLHDMGENYRLRTQKHFDDTYTWRKHTIASNATNTAVDATAHWIVPTADRANWAEKVYVNFMVSNEPLESESYPEFDTTNSVGLDDMKSTLERSIDKSDKYVTFYSASSSDNQNGRIQLDWLNDPATFSDDGSAYKLDATWKAMVEDVYSSKILK